MNKLVRILCAVLVAVTLCATLASCGGPSKNREKAVEALKAADYIVTDDTKGAPALFKLQEIDLDAHVTATKFTKDDEGNAVTEHVSIYYFADAENAKKAMEKIADDEKDQKQDNDRWISATRSGSVVYYGTKQAIKDAK